MSGADEWSDGRSFPVAVTRCRKGRVLMDAMLGRVMLGHVMLGRVMLGRVMLGLSRVRSTICIKG